MREFIEQVEMHLIGKSLHELKALVLKLAAKLPEESRNDFLSIMEGGRVIVKKGEASPFDSNAVLSHLKEMLEGIEDYSIEAYYYDHWHDDGYDIQSDDGFCDDFYKGYSGAIGMVEQGLYTEAAQAIELLFEIRESLDAFIDSEGLCFEMFIDGGMLNVDFKKLKSLLGYCQLMSNTENLRETLQGIYDRFDGYFSSRQKFIDVIEAGDELIPRREETLAEWVCLLLEQPPEDASFYIKETVQITGNIAIMEDFVKSSGAKTPIAYIDLCELYSEYGMLREKIIQIARKGVENTACAERKREALATLLANESQAANDSTTYAYAVVERFYSHMCIENFLPVYALSDAETTQAVIAKMDEQNKNPKNFHDYYKIHFLNQEYDMVFDAVKKDKNVLGWSGSLKGALFPYFIGLLAGFNESAKMIQSLIGSEELYKHLHRSMAKISPEQYEAWYDWCVSETGKRVDGIVSGSHRGSYYKAANLLVGLCEINTYMKDPSPHGILLTYAQKYPRHTAFKRELREALQTAKLTGVKV